MRGGKSEPYVCVPCHKVWKVAYTRGTFHCPHCGREGIRFSYRFRVPKKTNRKAWKYLEEQYDVHMLRQATMAHLEKIDGKPVNYWDRRLPPKPDWLWDNKAPHRAGWWR